MKNLFLIGLAIALFILFCYSVATVTYPFLNSQNYFKMNFGFKSIQENINKHKYYFLYNDCTKEYIIKIDEDGYFLKEWTDIYGQCVALQECTQEDATKFKDTSEAKRWVWIYGYYKHKEDSTNSVEGDKLMKEYDAEEIEKRKHIDRCRDTFKPINR